MSVVGAVPLSSMRTQSDVVAHLESAGIAKPIALWLCSSLKRGAGLPPLRWKFDIEAAKQMLQSYK